MNQESTLGIIKPDAVDRNLIGSIMSFRLARIKREQEAQK